MNKAKEVYYDSNGNMIKSTRYKSAKNIIKSEVDGKVFNKQLKLVDVIPCSSKGVTFWFADPTGRRYPMSDSVFAEYVENNPINFGSMSFEILKQGHVYSIGFKGEE